MCFALIFYHQFDYQLFIYYFFPFIPLPSKERGRRRKRGWHLYPGVQAKAAPFIAP